MVIATPSKIVMSFLAEQHGSFIDGKPYRKAECGIISVKNPATGEEVAEVAAEGKAAVDMAVAAARQSFRDGRWRELPREDQRAILWRFADLLEQNAQELAEINVIDNGMPLAFAKWEVQACVSWLRHFSGEPTRNFGRHASNAISGRADLHAYSLSQPVGVVALIIPWNAPSGNLMIKLAPALAAGNSCVVKPAENTPLAALRLAELGLEAGVPAGVFNVVNGFGADAGQALAEHEDVDKISFTGSTETGKRIVRSAAGNLKRVTLELGGKSPVIVFDDADIESAIPQVAMGIFANSGQVCFAGSRLYVQRGVYDRVVAGIADYAKSLKVGPGFDPESQLGPLISDVQRDKVADYIKIGKSQGGEVVTGGNPAGERGYFIEPTVFANVTSNMRIAREEIFGPVLVATPFDDMDAVVEAANDSRYGLGAGIFTNDVNKAHRLAQRIESGNVWVNCYGITHPALPFGGMKESGWGREMGSEVMTAFTESKSVFIALK